MPCVMPLQPPMLLESTAIPADSTSPSPKPCPTRHPTRKVKSARESPESLRACRVERGAESETRQASKSCSGHAQCSLINSLQDKSSSTAVEIAISERIVADSLQKVANGLDSGRTTPDIGCSVVCDAVWVAALRGATRLSVASKPHECPKGHHFYGRNALSSSMWREL